MDNETEIIKKYVRNLSKGMKDYLTKDIWPQKLSHVIQTNKLSEEQASSLETEVFLVLIGMENHSDFKTNIRKNVVGIAPEIIESVANDIEKNIFSEIKPLLDETEKANNEADKIDDSGDPTPAKPNVINPAGENMILDAQHNLPEEERKTLISGPSEPSRGPMLGNLKTSFTAAPVQPIPQPTQPAQTTTPPTQPQTPPQKYSTDPYREPIE